MLDPEELRAAKVRAGRKGGKIGGLRTHELHPHHNSRNGKRHGRKGGFRKAKLYPLAGHLLGKLHGHDGGIAATHLRWHVARHLPNPKRCPLCRKSARPTCLHTKTSFIRMERLI